MTSWGSSARRGGDVSVRGIDAWTDHVNPPSIGVRFTVDALYDAAGVR